MSTLTIQYFFLSALFLPIAAAIVALLVGRREWGNTLVQSLFALSGLLGFVGGGYFFLRALLEGVPSLVFSLFGFAGFTVSPFSMFFLLLVYVGVFLTSLYSIRSLPPYKDVYALPWLNVASAFFIVGMEATLMASTVFSFLLFWEVMSVAAYFLVIADKSDESLKAGWLYFIMTHIGFSCIAAGFFLLSGGNLFASWFSVAASALQLSPTLLTVAFLLLLAGFGSKAGLVPLHQWLPYAHPQAPSGSSALLSGVMLKVALFGFIQSLLIFPVLPFSFAVIIVVVGLTSAFFGALHAAVENDAKRLLAWSSIENMGLLFSSIGLYLIVSASKSPVLVPVISALALFITLHIVNHFLFKTGLFMAVGTVASHTHTRSLNELGGLAQRWPLFSGIFLALALAAAALPPFGTFFGEWSYFQGLAVGMTSAPDIAAVFALILALLALVGGLAIFAYVKMFSAIFLGRARTLAAEHVSPLPFLLWFPSFVCALLSLAVGLFAFPMFAHITAFVSVSNLIGSVTIAPGASMNAWLILGVAIGITALLFLFRIATNRMPARITDTWDCGQPISPRMQYSASGFSAPIRFFFRSILFSRKKLDVQAVSPENPWIATRQLVWSISSLWEQWLYRPLASFILIGANAVKKLQSGVIQMYLILVLVALIAALSTTLSL